MQSAFRQSNPGGDQPIKTWPSCETEGTDIPTKRAQPRRPTDVGQFERMVAPHAGV